MKKCAIVYASYHHKNTEKLVNAVKERFPDVTLIDALKTDSADLNDFDVIGFASGIYFFTFHKKLMRFAESNLPENKKTFLMCTCGEKSDRYFNKMEKIITEKKGTVEGKYMCFGYDTYGPLRMIVGLKKGHPDEGEISAAVEFVGGMV